MLTLAEGVKTSLEKVCGYRPCECGGGKKLNYNAQAVATYLEYLIGTTTLITRSQRVPKGFG